MKQEMGLVMTESDYKKEMTALIEYFQERKIPVPLAVHLMETTSALICNKFGLTVSEPELVEQGSERHEEIMRAVCQWSPCDA